MKVVNWMVDTLTNTVEELYKLYHRDIVRFFAEHLADREACWDLCHEVYVRLLITLASGTRLQYPQRWLMRVAKNLLIDTYPHQQAASEANLPGDSHELAMLASDATTFKTLLERADMLDVIVETFRCRRLLCVRERRSLCSQPGCGGRASCCKRSTCDDGSRSCFLQMRRFLSISMHWCGSI